jgi:hypothetical protein
MRPLLLLALTFPSLGAPLQLVRAILSDSDGGAALSSGSGIRPGETIFFSCRVRNYQKTAEERVKLAYTVQAFDAKGVPLVEAVKNDIQEEVSPQDKDWMPRIATEFAVPPLIAAGTYQILVLVEDQVAKSKAELKVPFEVRGHVLAPSDTLTLENLQFFRSEDDTQPLEKPVYRAGDAVWTRFDITGFRYGAKNKIDVSYVVSVLDHSGKVLWTQPEPTSEQTESFYPKLWIPASMSVTTQKNTVPGEYGIAIQVKDAIGNQSFEKKAAFAVE